MALLVAALVLFDPGGQLEKFELGVFDLRQRFFAQKTQYSDQICVVVIDEQSVKDFEPQRR